MVPLVPSLGPREGRIICTTARGGSGGVFGVSGFAFAFALIYLFRSLCSSALALRHRLLNLPCFWGSYGWWLNGRLVDDPLKPIELREDGVESVNTRACVFTYRGPITGGM